MRRSQTLRWTFAVCTLVALVATSAAVGLAPSPADAAPAAPAQTAPNCGARLTKTLLPYRSWTCTFVEEFNGTALDTTKWRPQLSSDGGFASRQDCYVDDPDNIKVSGGTLKLSVVKEPTPVTCRLSSGTYQADYTSASVNTYRKFSQTFGRFEFRAKFPVARVPGLHGALWLFPENWNKYGPWPLSGEIDVAEVYSQYNDRAIPFVHYWPPKASQTNNYCLLDPTRWHTYVAEWTTTNIKISYDGRVCVNERITPTAPLVAPQPFDHPFMLSLTQGLGLTTNALDPARAPTFPATLEVDWVKVWK